MSVAVLHKQGQVKVWVRDIIASFLASIIISIAAPISLKLLFLPVAFTFQNNLVLFLAVLMGSKRGLMMVMFYLMQGVMGFPVFAGGGFGIVHLIGPSGGYLVGYLVAAYVSGHLAERCEEKSPIKLFQIMGIGNLIIYFFGVCYLSQFIGIKSAFLLGVLPFILGDLIKLIFFARIPVLKSVRMTRYF